MRIDWGYYCIIAGVVALFVGGVWLSVVASAQERKTCGDRGGVYHCQSVTTTTIVDGKTGVGLGEQCDCYTRDGRLLLPGAP